MPKEKTSDKYVINLILKYRNQRRVVYYFVKYKVEIENDHECIFCFLIEIFYSFTIFSILEHCSIILYLYF